MMHEKGVTIEIGGCERFLVCTTAAYEMICDKYGDMESMVEAFEGPADLETDTPEELANKTKLRSRARQKVFTISPWLVSVLANQGAMIQAGTTKLESPLTEEYIKLVTMPKDIERLMNDAMEAIRIGFGTEHVADEGKRDPVLEELDRKNVEGAAG